MAEARRFDFAVILGGMRTGSNLLEESIASIPGVTAHGELFNPYFFGKPGRTRAFGIDMRGRDADPIAVLSRMTEADGFAVFRLFDDHDSRVLDHVLANPRAAKIVLTRDALEAWVSLKIAQSTGQWWAGGAGPRKSARIAFDGPAFDAFRRARADFEGRVAKNLQQSGQAAFRLSYDDLFDANVIDGVSRFLDLEGKPDRSRVRARVQNPAPLSEKLTNPAEAERWLAADAADLDGARNYEPSRGPGLKGFVACRSRGLLYIPIRGAGADPFPDWLTTLDPGGETHRDMTQKDLRKWWRAHPGHRSFTVLRHPLQRAWDSFARHIMPVDGFADIRAALIKGHALEVPDSQWDVDLARRGFAAFLTFLEANLGGQTNIRTDASWSSQGSHLAAVAGFTAPDRVFRENERAEIAEFVGVEEPPPAFGVPGSINLAEVVDDEIEKLALRAYRRDYLAFGFGEWRAGQAA